jgi:TolA-binding protein
MKNIKTLLFVNVLVSSYLFASEPSAYGAGDLDEASPYGLTQEEKVLLETKKHLKKVEIKTNTQENKVDSLRERLDGLQTILEGLTRKNHEIGLELQKLQKDSVNFDEYGKRIEELVTSNSKDIQTIKELLKKNYVTKDELSDIVENLNLFKKLVADEFRSIHTEGSLDSMKKATILKKARRYYDKKNYTKAIKYYKYLLARNYKPARSSYMIGEMYYYRKDYATAIAYFKESAKRYPQASYMPILLFHTGVAMKRTGDNKNAQNFFKVLVKKYPSSKEAKAAKKFLK